MLKYLITMLMCSVIFVHLNAQAIQVKGVVVDSKFATPLIGAHVAMQREDSSNTNSVISALDGSFLIDNLTQGNYLVNISYIGYEECSLKVVVLDSDINLEVIGLKEGIGLEEIQIVDKILPVIQKGDTTQYNAAAYKMLADANAEELIEKMPTVVIENGKIKAQGEDVKKVLVDGKPFFGNDPNAALLNLPAEVIDIVQIFDQQSEQTQFTGFDDGEISKTINIITKANKRNGQFGKIYTAYGNDDKYKASGNINFFNGDQRISIIGMTNNVNEQNFSTEDLLGVVTSTDQSRAGGNRGGGGGNGAGGGRARKGESSSGASVNDFLVPQQGGITTVSAMGINFSDKWGEKMDVSASYFYNKSDNIMEQLVHQKYFDLKGIDDIYNEESNLESTNINHRFTGQLKYEISDKNSLIWLPKLTWQGNESIEIVLGQTIVNETVMNQSDVDFDIDLSALSLDNSLLWKHKFDKERRTFSINLTTAYASQKGENYLLSESVYWSDQTDSILLNQQSILDLNSINMAANLQYTEPIGESSMLMLNYRASYQQEESNKSAFDFNEDSQEYDLFNSSLSNVFSNDYFIQQLAGGLNYRKNNLTLTGKANLQWAQLLNDQSYPYTENDDQTFTDVLPMVNLRYKVSRTENLSLVYKTNTQLPSIEQIQNVVDNNNPLQLTIGNPNLVQSYQHNLFARYSKTNTEKSSVFYAFLKGGYTNNYIANSTYLPTADNTFPILIENEITEGSQLTLPVNLDGYWDLRSFITYGFPIQPLKSNLNIDFSADYVKTPGLVNEALNFSNQTTLGLGLTLGSNISDKIDFTLSSRSNYNLATNTLQTESDTDYLNQSTHLKLNLVLADGLVFRNDLTQEFFYGLSNDFDQNYLLWNMSIGKKIFKDQRGEISLSVFDLLNQNNNLSRLTTEIYTEDVQTNVLQQYFMLSFTIDLRDFTTG